MNRSQRKQAGKGQPEERIDIAGIVVHFANGQYVNLDLNKIKIVDKETDRPLFSEILEQRPPQINDIKSSQPSSDEFADEQTPRGEEYSVAFDTPEGRMVYVKKGNWSGVRAARNGE